MLEKGEGDLKVLVAVDGSDQSWLIAQSLHAFSPLDQVFLLYAIHVPRLAYPATGMSIGQEFSERAEQALRAEGTRILDEVSSRLPPDVGTIHRRIEPGLPGETILSLADKEEVDCIVVGSRGLGMIREHALGSVSHRVLTHATRSTLVVKSRVNRMKEVLLPIEHPEDAERALAFLAQKPFRGEMRTTILHVIPFAQPVLPVGALMPEELRKDLTTGAEKFTQEVAARLSSLGYLTSTMVTPGAPSLVINEQGHAVNADLILMGAHKGRGVSRFFLGSVSHAVVHHSSCSVFLLK